MNNLLFLSSTVYPSDFVFELFISAPNTTITLPLTNSDWEYEHHTKPIYNFQVYYGDGTDIKTVTSYNDSNATHTYVSAGTYQVKITGLCEGFVCYNTGWTFALRLTKITQWGNVGFKKVNFMDCDNLTSIPQGSRGLSTANIVDNLLQRAHIPAIPKDLCESLYQCRSYAGAFMFCTSLNEIPPHIFDKSAQTTTFSEVFSVCWNIKEIPQNLFQYNSIANVFSSAFSSCSGLTAIPDGLFNNNPLAGNFYNVFSWCSNIKTIPNGLFDNNSNVTNFASAFEHCSSLNSIPEGLFFNNPNVYTFDSVFKDCINLTTVPEIFKVNSAVFAEAFSGCINLTGNASTLWLSFPGSNGTDCFKDASKLNNYNSIPEDWGGPLMTGNPSSFVITNVSCNTVDLYWNPNNLTHHQGFEIQFSKNGSDYTKISAVTKDSSFYQCNSLESSTNYWFKLAAYAGIRIGFPYRYSNFINASTHTMISYLPAPTNLDGVALNRYDVKLTWNTVSDVSGYSIERRLYTNPFEEIAIVNNVSTYTDTTPPEAQGMPYSYRLRSYKNTAYSNYSNLTTVTTPDYYFNLSDWGESVRLKDVFDLFNSGAFGYGNSLIGLDVSTVETETAVLEEGSISGNYYSIIMFPTVPGVQIKGVLDTDLILFNGTSQVMVDGRVNRRDSSSLTISNTGTGSAIHYVGATDTSVLYTKIIGDVIVE